MQVITSLVPSDHKVIIASSCKDGTECRDKKVTICKQRAVNPKSNARFLANLTKFDFQEDNSRSAQEEFNQFYKELESLLDTYYPERTVRISSRDPEYMTPAIKRNLKVRNKLVRQGHTEKADVLSKRIEIEIAKKNSIMMRSAGGKVTSKEMWAAVKKLTHRATNTDQAVAGIDAISLNEHYAHISNDSDYKLPPMKSTASPANEELISEFQVFQLLDKLKPTATGLDKIPAWFLRLGAPVFAKHLSRLFNKSLMDGVVPSQWKRARIRPIAKVQAPAAPAVFRPISITAVLSRVMEKLVVRNFIYPAFLTAPLPLSFADQFAFRPSGSTTAAIIALLQKITTLLITNPFVVVIVLDFSKAFDTVRHATLMEKYSMLDLDGLCLQLAQQFLHRS